MCKVTALLTLPGVFVKPKEAQRHNYDSKKRQFIDPSGDHLSLLKVFD